MTRLYSLLERRMKRTIFYLITGLLSVATLSSCGTLSNVPKVSDEPVNVDKTTQQTNSTALKNQEARKQARHLLDKHKYAAAVNFISDEIIKGADEQALAEEYLEAANTCLEHADKLMKGEDYLNASKLFKTVRDGYPKVQALQKRVKLTRTQIADQLYVCAEKLMEAGLVAYRAEEFTKSIDIWQQILVFNPTHQAANNAIQTTKQQISKLKMLENKSRESFKE